LISKIVILFLVVMGTLAWFGKMHWLGAPKRKQVTCKACGRHRIGKGPCECRGKT